MSPFTIETMTRRQLRKCYSAFFIGTLITILAIQYAALELTLAGMAYLPEVAESPFWSKAFNVAVNAISCYVTPFLIFPIALRRIPKSEKLPVHPLSRKGWFQSMIFCFGVGYFIMFLNSIVMEKLANFMAMSPQSAIENYEQSLPFLLSLLFFGIVAPVFEELIFRGYLLSRVRVLGDTSAVILTGLAFGLFHTNLQQFAYASVLGMVFASITLLTGSLRDTILLHVAINTASVLVVALPPVFQTVFSGFVLISIAASLLLFLQKARRFHMEPGPLRFSAREKFRAGMLNVWLWLTLFIGLCLGLWVAFTPAAG